jgi:hypothetical protein
MLIPTAYALLAVVSLASPAKIALLPISPGAGVDEKTAESISGAAAAEIHKVPGISLVTQQDMAALLGFDKQRALLGCQEESCLAEVGGALGVDRLVIGNLSKLAESWLVSLKLMDVKKARLLTRADRRLRNGTLDDVLDALPEMVAEVFSPVEPPAPPSAVTAPVPAVAPAAIESARESPASAPAKTLPPAWAEEPVRESLVKALRNKLLLARDGRGTYVAFLPRSQGQRVLFSGDGKTFFRQYLPSEKGDYVFWEPRAQGTAELKLKQNRKPELVCGKARATLEFLSDAQAREIVDQARFLKPRWRRVPRVLAKDEAGTFYLVDQARQEDGASPKDLRLYVGPRGHLEGSEVTDSRLSENEELFTVPAGQLKVALQAGEATGAEWIQGDGRTPLTLVRGAEVARTAFLELGVYAGEKLGTACDGYY